MSATRDRVELLDRAQKRSIHEPSSEHARYVVDKLGSRLVAASLGLRDTRSLQKWASGEAAIKSPEREHRLQVLYRVTYLLSEAYSGPVAAAFLRGSNPYLDDRAPMVLLATDEPQQVEHALVVAAQALLD